MKVCFVTKGLLNLRADVGVAVSAAPINAHAVARNHAGDDCSIASGVLETSLFALFFFRLPLINQNELEIHKNSCGVQVSGCTAISHTSGVCRPCRWDGRMSRKHRMRRIVLKSVC